MDVLSDVLQTVRLRSHVYGRLELTSPWGFRLDFAHDPHPVLYAVSRGQGWLEVEGEPAPIPLSGGDFVLLPRGTAHVFRDRLDTPHKPLQELLTAVGGWTPIFRGGGGGAPTTMVNGCLRFEDAGAGRLVDALPSVIHVKGDDGQPMPALAATLQFLAIESASGAPGSEAIRSRLADILFVQAIRAHAASHGDCRAGWLKALHDPQIGVALTLMHQTPEAPWSVGSLAAKCAMSRSAFALRFRELVGTSPAAYLVDWRMQQAARRLRSGDATVAAVARAIGYETEAAFGKAFKRWSGASPGDFRKGATKLETAAV